MASSKIVVLDTITAELRDSLSHTVPAGFDISFADMSSQESAAAAAAEADYLMIWAGYVPGPLVRAARKARLIQKVGEGTDRIDVAAAAEMGIPVAKTSGSNGVSVAEVATMLILATLRRLPKAHNAVVSGAWPKFELRVGAYELRGKQVGIVGLGKIGRIVAEHMHGFRANVVYTDSVRPGEDVERALGVTYLPLDDLLRTSDVVTLHVPLTPATRGLIGRRELGLMKPNAILVNTCRGAVVDERALVEALSARRIRGAGIDAFEKEPPDRDNPLFALDNVVLTPHYAGGTEDAVAAGIRHAFANILKVHRGEPLDPADLARS